MNLSWKNIEDVINTINPEIFKKYKNIYGIPRGGLIPSVLISHKFNIPISLVIESNTLIIDDICDSGETMGDIINDTFCLRI